MQKFHPKTAEYTLFSSGHRKFSRINHMLGHKASVSKFRKTEIIISIFSDHRDETLENKNNKIAAEKLQRQKHVEMK